MLLMCIASSLAAVAHNYGAYLDNSNRYLVELQERLRLENHALVGPGGKQIDPSLRVLRPPSVAASVFVGFERTLPLGWDFGPAGAETLAPYPLQDPLAVAGTVTDGESVIRIFGGLLALAFGFWTITRNRQSGWLDASAWFPIPQWWIAALLMVSGVVVLALSALIWTASVLAVAESIAESDLGIGRFQTWLVVWLYLVTLFGVGAAIARAAMNPLVSGAVAVAAWTGLVLLGPQLFSVAVRLASDLPPRAAQEQERREQYADRQRAAEVQFARLLTETSRPARTRSELGKAAEAAFPAVETVWRNDMRAAREESNAMRTAWQQIHTKWLRRIQSLARFTPGTLLQSALAETAGVGPSALHVWEEAIVRHEGALNHVLFDDPGAITLRLPWQGTVVPWGHIWHAQPKHSDLPRLNESAVAAQLPRGLDPIDLAAGLLQAAVALSLAVCYPVRRAYRAQQPTDSE